MIRKTKMYSRPKKAYEKSRIEEENKLVELYGLKNKREIWKTAAKVNYFRKRAKALAKSPDSEQKVLFDKLHALGLKTSTISDVLALTTEDILKRRLATVVFHRKMSNTVKQARQLIVHRKVSIHGKVINVPSYVVPVADEASIVVQFTPAAKANKESKTEEAKE